MHISWSRLNTRLRCAEQERRRYENNEKIPPETPLIIGGGMHKAVEKNMRSKLETGKLLELGEVQEAAVDAINASWEAGVTLSELEKDKGERTVKGEVVDMTVSLATCHHLEIAPSIDPLYVERKIEVDLGGYDLTLLMFLDLLDKSKLLVETKSSAKAWTQDQADTSGQVTAYCLGTKVIDGYIPDARFDVIKKLKRGPEVQQLYTGRTDEDFVPFLELIGAAARDLQVGNFFPNGWGTYNCKPTRCGYYRTCRYVNLKRRPLN